MANKFMLCTLLLLSQVGVADSRSALNLQLESELKQQWQGLSQQPSEELIIKISGLPADYQPPACDQDFQLQLTQELKPGRNPVQVACPSRQAWQLNLMAELQVWRPVVVTRVPLLNKSTIQATQLSLQKRNIAQLHRGYFTQLNQVVGSISKRSLKPGTTLTPSMVKQPVLIERGQTITLRSSNPVVTVEMAGEALRKGRAGELIKVRNISSGKIVHGRVISSELVQIQ